MSSRQRGIYQQQMQASSREYESSEESEGRHGEAASATSVEGGQFVESGAEAYERRLDQVAQQLAQVVTDELLSPTEEGPIHMPKTNIYYSDVEYDSERFRFQLDFCSEHGVRVPCLQVRNEDSIPIDFANGANLDDNANNQLQCHYEATRYRLASEESSAQTGWHEPDEARSFFRNRLIRFLTSRFKSNTSKNSPGVPFRVITGKAGRRVHYSRAYFFDPSLVFGGPTPSVDGYLHPGRYIFGVAGLGLAKPIFIHHAEFDVPEKNEAYLTEL